SGHFERREATEIEVDGLRFGQRGERFASWSWCRFKVSVTGDQLSLTVPNPRRAWDDVRTRFPVEQYTSLIGLRGTGKPAIFKRSTPPPRSDAREATMPPPPPPLPRREVLCRIGGGFGAVGLAGVFADAGLLPSVHAALPADRAANPLSPRPP